MYTNVPFPINNTTEPPNIVALIAFALAVMVAFDATTKVDPPSLIETMFWVFYSPFFEKIRIMVGRASFSIVENYLALQFDNAKQFYDRYSMHAWCVNPMCLLLQRVQRSEKIVATSLVTQEICGSTRLFVFVSLQTMFRVCILCNIFLFDLSCMKLGNFCGRLRGNVIHNTGRNFSLWEMLPRIFCSEDKIR